MHTLRGKSTTFNYNSDFSGHVILSDSNGVEFQVLFEDIKLLVSEAVMARRIEHLENQTADDILGLRPIIED